MRGERSRTPAIGCRGWAEFWGLLKNSGTRHREPAAGGCGDLNLLVGLTYEIAALPTTRMSLVARNDISGDFFDRPLDLGLLSRDARHETRTNVRATRQRPTGSNQPHAERSRSMGGVEAQALPAFRASRVPALCGEATGARLDRVTLRLRLG